LSRSSPPIRNLFRSDAWRGRRHPVLQFANLLGDPIALKLEQAAAIKNSGLFVSPTGAGPSLRGA
jgi:hypothetical protein